MNRFTPICAKQHLVASFWRPDYRADRTPVEVIVISTPAGWAGANIAVRLVLASIFSAVAYPVALRKEDVAYSPVAAVFMEEAGPEPTT